MTRRRWAVLAALVVGVAAAAPAATAAIVEPSPAEGSVVGSHAAFRFTSDSKDPVLGRPDAVMRIDGPGEFAVAGAPNDKGFSSVVLDTRCPTDPCGQPAPNGPYVVVEDRIGDQDATRRFAVRIGGLPVPEVGAALEERTVTVRWKPGPEADVTSWQVADDLGAVKTLKAPRNEAGAIACPEAGCSVAFEYPPSSGGSRTFSVRAARPCGEEGCEVLGAAATSGKVDVPGPAAPGTAAPTPGGGGASSAPPRRTGGSGSSGTAGFPAFSPKLGLPKLPPLPGAGAPIAAPQVADTFDETLDYGDRELPEIAEDEELPRAGRDDSRLISTGDGLLQDEQVVRGVAAAMVLGLTGAHLRSWLARTREEDLEL